MQNEIFQGQSYWLRPQSIRKSQLAYNSVKLINGLKYKVEIRYTNEIVHIPLFATIFIRIDIRIVICPKVIDFNEEWKCMVIYPGERDARGRHGPQLFFFPFFR